MTPDVRKFVLTVHLAFSIGWIGAVVAYLVLGVSAVTTANAETVRAAWIAMDLTGWYAIVPLAVGSVLTGTLMAIVTPWGLFRHYWVLISFALTMFSVTILLLHMPTVSAQALTCTRLSSFAASAGASFTPSRNMPAASVRSGGVPYRTARR